MKNHYKMFVFTKKGKVPYEEIITFLRFRKLKFALLDNTTERFFLIQGDIQLKCHGAYVVIETKYKKLRSTDSFIRFCNDLVRETESTLMSKL